MMRQVARSQSLRSGNARFGGNASPAGSPYGFTVLELLFVLAITATMSSVAVPGVTHAVARQRTVGAVRALRGTFQRARATAVARGANVAVRFTAGIDGIRYGLYLDGDRDGISSADIADGSDPPLDVMQSLSPFGGPEFGVWPGVVSPEGTALAADDPIRFGSSNLVSFSPAGSCTGGTAYIKGANGLQYAVRVYGDTGKTQVLRYVASQRAWVGE